MRYRFPSGVKVAASAIMLLHRGLLKARLKGSGTSECVLVPAPGWEFSFPDMIETNEMKRSKKHHGKFNLRVTFRSSFGEYARVYLLSKSDFDADGQMEWDIAEIKFCDGPPPQGQWQVVIPEKATIATL